MRSLISKVVIGFGFMALTAMALTQLPTAKRGPASDEQRQPNSSYSCRIITGYGTATGYGSSQKAALKNARDICGDKLIDQAFAQRGYVDPAAELELACVNLTCS